MTQNNWNTPLSSANGQLLIAQTTGTPAWNTLTAGTNCSITNGAGSSTINFTAGDFDFISSTTASTSSSVVFTGLSATYNLYLVVLANIVPATDSVNFNFRTSTDNGSTWNGTYGSSIIGNDTSAIDATESQTESFFRLTSFWPLGSAANESCAGEVWIYKPSLTDYTQIFSMFNYEDDGGVFNNQFAGGATRSAADVDAIQFIMSSGTIESGTFKLYGFKA